jgi:hypothetical protein
MNDNTAIWLKGYCQNTVFSNCVFVLNPIDTVLNMTGGGDQIGIRFVSCLFETPGSDIGVFINVSAGMQNMGVDVSILDSTFRSTSSPRIVFKYMVKDDTVGHIEWHNIKFSSCYIESDELRFKGGHVSSYQPSTLVTFIDCHFPNYPVAITQIQGTCIGAFVRCTNINPVGLIATPFSGRFGAQAISIASSIGRQATPYDANYNITIYDTAVLLNSTGGTGVNITIYDKLGNVVLSAGSSLASYYIPIGFKVNFGPFSVAPTITVIGV